MITEDKHLSLEEKVYRILEEEILTGKMKKGEPLTETALSKRLGVSRTPVRCAIHRLSEDGLVESSANKGAVVVGITEDDLVDIYRIRVRLEGLASSIAAKNITEDGINTLKESVELAEFYIGKNNADRIKELDSTFHETIYRATGNRLLCRTLSELHGKIKAYRKISLSSEGRTVRSVEEHRAILAAIERGDAETADKLTSLHIEEALENILKVIEKNKTSKGAK